MLSTVNRQHSSHSIILLPGLFETDDSILFNTIESSFGARNFTTHRLSFFSDIQQDINGENVLGVDSFKSILGNLNKEIARVPQTDEPLTIIGHSIGAFLALISEMIPRNIICLDISLHPEEMFKTTLCNGQTCRWPGVNIGLSKEFVSSASDLPQIDDILNRTKSRIYFIGAEKGGCEISIKYHRLAPSKSLLIKRNCDHDFTGHENWVAGTIQNILDGTI